MQTIAALIVAAGRGSRFGGEGPKQYAPLAGKPLLRHAIEGFLATPGITQIRCAIHADDRGFYADAVTGLTDQRLLEPVIGGATRQASVKAGLDSLAGSETPPDCVLIHDAARALVDTAVVERVLAALTESPGAIPALLVVDTLKRAVDDKTGGGAMIAETVPRTNLWRAQTPQGFRFADIMQAHQTAPHDNFTDDADLLQAAGKQVALVPGSESLLKVTTMADLHTLEAHLAAQMETRTGFGYDVHAFGPGDHVTLGGVRIEHSKGLTGHSDADVGLHALCDAIYGALADGDIGQHFPPSQSEWRGADSSLFLVHAAGLVHEHNGAILHLDLTLVCERPKIGPHREAMRARIADIAGLPLHRVAVKATTSERLGFTGREEGIAAHAVATLRLPVPPDQ